MGLAVSIVASDSAADMLPIQSDIYGWDRISVLTAKHIGWSYWAT